MSVADALAAHVGRKPVRLAAPPAREPLTPESLTDEPFESGAALSALPQTSVTPRAQTAATDAAAIDAVVADLVAEATLKQAGGSQDRADTDTQRAAAHDDSQDDVLASLTALPEPPPRRRFDTTPIAWGGLGFIAGALVWHFIGFWAFVSTIVLNQDADQRTVVWEKIAERVNDTAKPDKAAGVTRTATRDKSNGAAPNNADTACVALHLDRATGETVKTPCPVSSLPLRDAGRRPRAALATAKPRLQDPVSWAGATAVDTAEAPATEAIDESAFSMELRPGP